MRREILQRILAARREGRTIIRALDVESGAEELLDPQSDTSALARAARQALHSDAGRHVTVEGRTWFLTVYNTAWEIVIIGAVHIAQALASLGQAAGYHVRMIDPRALYATEERFPGLSLERQWPERAFAQQPLTPRSAVVALAHDPKIDDEALIAALRSPAFYVGALGSRRTHARRIERLGKQGLSPELLTRIRGPVGLSIGARTPAEIAIAILGEIVKTRRVRPRIAGVVLAAGMSSRMGNNKLLMPVRGRALIQHAARAARDGGLDPVIVVTGHQAEAVRAALKDENVIFVHNAVFADGLSTSLRAGISALTDDCDGAMVLLGDMPDVTANLVRRLKAAFDPVRGRSLVVATAKGERGHPVLWDRRFFAAMCNLSGDAGAKSLMTTHAEKIFEIEAGDNAPLTDIDTPDTYAAHSELT
jgi:CTP:molybdopterin cytidylyltransferase MocA/xanthine/CO dehydrogenase XdhC/CoxF family maturation factor